MDLWAALAEYFNLSFRHWLSLVVGPLFSILSVWGEARRWLGNRFGKKEIPKEWVVAGALCLLFVAQFQTYLDVRRENFELKRTTDAAPRLAFVRAGVDTLTKVDRFPEGDIECIVIEFENAPQASRPGTDTRVIADVAWSQGGTNLGHVMGWWIRNPPYLMKPQELLTFDLDSIEFPTGARRTLVLAARELPNGLYHVFDKDSFSYSGWQFGPHMLDDAAPYDFVVRLRGEGVDVHFSFMVVASPIVRPTILLGASDPSKSQT